MKHSFFKNAKASIMEFLDNQFDVSSQFYESHVSKKVNAVHRELHKGAANPSPEMKNDIRMDARHELAIQMQDFYRPDHERHHSFNHRKITGEIELLRRERYPFYLQFIL